MSDDLRQSLENMVKKLGSDLGLPKVDVDKLIETHKKNFDALVEAVRLASAGAREVAAKQRELIESTINDAFALVGEVKPGVDAASLLAQHRETVAQTLDKTIASTGAIADQIQTLNMEMLNMMTDRLTANLGEIRASFSARASSPTSTN
jgi:phasin family protein